MMRRFKMLQHPEWDKPRKTKIEYIDDIIHLRAGDNTDVIPEMKRIIAKAEEHNMDIVSVDLDTREREIKIMFISQREETDDEYNNRMDRLNREADEYVHRCMRMAVSEYLKLKALYEAEDVYPALTAKIFHRRLGDVTVEQIETVKALVTEEQIQKIRDGIDPEIPGEKQNE